MRNRTFLRYIVSYALVLMIPFLSISFILDRAMVRRYAEEVAADDAHMLSRLQESLDADLQQLFNLAYAIQNTSSLNPKNIGDDVIARRNAISLLGTYRAILTLPELVMIYRSGDPVCITDTTAIAPEKLFNQQLVYARHTVEDFYRTVDDKNSLIVWPRESASQFGGQTQDYLTVFLSVGAGTVNPRQRTVFVIPARRLEDRIRSLTGTDTSVLVTDREGQLLLSTDEAFSGESAIPDGQNTVRLAGMDYSVLRIRTGLAGWTCTVLCPAERLTGPLRSYRRWIVALIGLMLILGGVLIGVMSWGSYRPIRKLAEKARSYAPESDGPEAMRQVEAALDSLSDRSNTYRSMLDQSTDSLRQIVERLQKKPVSLAQARSVCSDAINVTVQTLISIRDRMNSDLPSSAQDSQSDMDSVQELTVRLENLVEQACTIAKDADSRASDQRVEAMKQYVRDNCLSSDFSLQMAADHFGLTPSNFSHYFKNTVGVGLSEYVQEIRRMEACRLLAETDEPVQEVGRLVGMPNVSSFIRSFKQQTGLTPGQYRAEHALEQ